MLLPRAMCLGLCSVRPVRHENATDDVSPRVAVSRMITNHWGGSVAIGDALDSSLRVLGTTNLHVADVSGAEAYPARLEVKHSFTF